MDGTNQGFTLINPELFADMTRAVGIAYILTLGVIHLIEKKVKLSRPIQFAVFAVLVLGLQFVTFGACHPEYG